MPLRPPAFLIICFCLILFKPFREMSNYRPLIFMLLIACLSGAYGQAPVITPKPPQIVLPLDAAGNYKVNINDIATIYNATDSVTHTRFHPKEFTCADLGPQTITLTASTNGSATNLTPGRVSFSAPLGVAFDVSGNCFIAENTSYVVRRISPQGEVTTYAGTGQKGNANGPADQASFSEVVGIVCDSLGNVYVSDSGNNTIRKISTDRVVSTYAGTGEPGLHNGTAAEATFFAPSYLAFDRHKNMYVSDLSNNRIRKISADGMVTTLAGTGSKGYFDGPGNVASFDPYGMAVDSHGNIFLCDAANRRIRKITPDGTVSTYAGDGQSRLADGPLLSASFIDPLSITIDDADNMFIGDANAVRVISPAGVVSTLAGNYDEGGSDGNGRAASFAGLGGIGVDLCGNIYAADFYNCAIRKIELTGKVTTYAGSRNQQVVNGNVGPSTCQSSVTIIPVQVQSTPTITVVFSDINISDCAKLPNYAIRGNAADNCPGSIIKFTQSPAPGTVLTDDVPLTVTITATDQSGGTATVSFKVIATNTASAPGRSVSVTASAQKICAGNSVTFKAEVINGDAGTGYQWLVNGINSGPNAPEFTTASLKDGDVVNCAVTTASGCAIPNIGLPITMNVSPYPTIALKPKEQILAGAGIQLNPAITGNIMAYTWTPAAGLNNAAIQSPVASPAVTTSYHLMVSTIDGCDAGADVTVVVVTEVKIPNTFTPNGDGINDLWEINALADYPDCTVKIFNRYGTLLYKSTGYGKPWNGTYKSKSLATGAYYYVIDLKDGSKPKSGEVSIIR